MVCPAVRERAVLILAVAAWVGALGWYFERHRPDPSDFSYSWVAATELRAHANPWDRIGPGKPIDRQFPMIYPMPAIVAALPFSYLPEHVANIAFTVLGAALLAWALTRRERNPQLLAFLSMAFIVCIPTVQWTPWLTVAAVAPAFAFLLACKPSIGLAICCAFPSRMRFALPAIFALITIAIWPSWVRDWLGTLASATHMSAPVTRWTVGGPLLLLSALRWRTPEGRLLLALSCIPQTPVLYDALPLFLIVRRWAEGWVLVVGTVVVAIAGALRDQALPYNAWMTMNGRWMLAAIYLPALAIVLRRPGRDPE